MVFMKTIFYLLPVLLLSCSSMKEINHFDKRLLGLEKQIIFLKKNIEIQHEIMKAIEIKLGIRPKKIDGEKGEVLESPSTVDQLEELNSNTPDYDKAVGLYKSERYEDAEIQFERFIRDYPNAELTPNALYYLGSCHFKLANYLLAIIEFQKLTDAFKESDRVPDGLLKLILAYKAINDLESAKISYKRLVKEYGNSDAAKTAIRDIKFEDSDDE